jgi:ADP-L-glycero-D-manno-heptose 6-epimerase
MTRIIVTGAAGFIGSNLVRGLNARGFDEIIAVDNLSQGEKFRNLADLRIADYVDKARFYDDFEAGRFGRIDTVFHQGACSDTMQHDGRYMLDNNYRASRRLLDHAQSSGTRLIYASSAAVYGASSRFVEQPDCERPLNVYGYSKLLFDQIVRRICGGDFSRLQYQVAGLRYFNVYGWGEQHKGRMASVAFHHFGQYRSSQRVRLFGAWDGYEAGTQSRDFVLVDDVVRVNLWLFDHPQVSGIFNCGSGRAQPFNDVARAVIAGIEGSPLRSACELAAEGSIEYQDFPEALKGKYQSFTQADLRLLREAGFDAEFTPVEQGVARYMRQLLAGRHDPA